MKANELMVGDWVYLLGTPCRIKDIIDDGVINYEKDVTPIPLTEEILEKNGYTCKRSLDKEIISYNWKSPDRRVTLNDQNGSPWFCIILSDGMMEEVMIGITYVHELQHALRLCGIEKEIML